MDFPRSNSYDKAFARSHMMGPNALKMLEEMTLDLSIREDMRVLDLGCGQGLTSIFLAREFGATVFATDLWISATDNFKRFKEAGLEKRIIPIHAEAHSLPYAEEYFDLIVSIDSYHYFGAEKEYLPEHLSPLLKPDGKLAIAVPGLKREFSEGVPAEMKPFWSEDMSTIRSLDWWRDNIESSGAVRIDRIGEMECFREAWDDWLECDNEFAQRDIAMMEAEAGNYFNLISIIAIK